MYYLAEAPDQSRGGLIIPFEANEEGERWMVRLVGLNNDYPSTNEAGFCNLRVACLCLISMPLSQTLNR